MPADGLRVGDLLGPRERADAAGRAAGAGLSRSPGQDHRAVSGRGHRRRDAPHRGGLAVAQMGPAGHRREQDRRGGQYRSRSGLQRRPRRLHAAVGAAAAAGDQPESLPQAGLRPRPVRAGLGDGDRAQRAGGESEKDRRQYGRGLHRLRETESGESLDRDAGKRIHVAPHLRTLPADGAGEIPECALSRLGAGAAGAAGGRRRRHVRQSRRLARPGEGRPAQADRGGNRQAHDRAARRADDRRDAAGICIRGLVRGGGAAQDAGADRRPAQRRHRRGDQAAGYPQALRRSVGRSGRRHAGRDRDLHARGGRALEQRDQGRQGEAGIGPRNCPLWRPSRPTGDERMNIHERSWPTEGLTRIPYWIYADRELYAEEQARIFRGDAWTFLCLEAELPRPETFRTSNLGDMPVVVTRDRDGEIHAFENRCAHRGSLLCLRERGEAKDITCVYHNWTYDLTGKLTGVAFRRGIAGKGGMPADCKPEEHAPRQLRTECFAGMVFGTLGAATPPLEQYLGPEIAAHIKRVMRAPVKLIGGYTQILPSNSKLYVENTRDSYHASLLHMFFTTFRLNRLSQKGGLVVSESGGNHVSYSMRQDIAGK